MAWNEDLSDWYILNYNFKIFYLRRDDIIMKTNLKKAIINSLFIAIGLILHQIVPPILFGMKPDLSLAMMFIIILVNEDYKTTIMAGIITGILTALTTGFPGGQAPNVIDKIVTANLIYLMLLPMRNKANNQIKTVVVSVVGTLISGIVFLGSAAIIAGLPGTFTALFIGTVLPATLVNAIATTVIYNAIQVSLKHAKITL